MARNNAVGIDLGTTSSCMGVFRHGRVEIIASTPSYVAFTDTERLIGDPAKDQLAMNPSNTVFDAKRLIGRKFDDAAVQGDINHWPFHVFSDNNKLPKIMVEYQRKQTTFTPEEISSMVLTKMKEMAEEYLGAPVENAVVSVPASFGSAQRQAIKNAGTNAGLNVIRIMNELSASAMAYGLNMQNAAGMETNMLILDMGGGTTEASILTIEDGVFFEVKSIAGDSHLGGHNFDNRMVDHFIREFQREYHRDLTPNRRAIQRLRIACERAKWTLSVSVQAEIEIDYLFEGIKFRTSISRARFEELCSDLFRRTLEPVERAMRDAKMGKSSIHKVVLVGGSTRIPKVQKLLQDFFDGKELNKSIINPHEAVVYGAAIQAAILSGDTHKPLDKWLLLDVAPLSLGIETAGGVMSTIIKRNTTIPTRQTHTFTTVGPDDDNLVLYARDDAAPPLVYRYAKSAVTIKVYEGERAMTMDNLFQNDFKFELMGPPEHGGIPVTFDVDANGIFNFSASCMPFWWADERKVANEKLKRNAARNCLANHCYDMKSAAKTLSYNYKEGLNWLEANKTAKSDTVRAKLRRIEAVCKPLVARLGREARY